MNSPYAFLENRVIDSGELEGLERYFSTDGKRFMGQVGKRNEIRVLDDKWTSNGSNNVKNPIWWVVKP